MRFSISKFAMIYKIHSWFSWYLIVSFYSFLYVGGKNGKVEENGNEVNLDRVDILHFVNGNVLLSCWSWWRTFYFLNLNLVPC